MKKSFTVLMTKNLFLVLLLVPGVLQAQTTLQEYYTLATTAYKAKNYSEFYTNIQKAGEINPYHQTVLYLRGKAAALTGKPDEALTCLKKAILINSAYPLQGVEDFNSIKDSKEFTELLDLQKSLSTSIIHSDTSFVVKNRRLHAEGISYNPKTSTFYLGSIHQRKVIKIDSKGVVTDFCPSAFEGMTSTFGVRVDAGRNRLWVCSSPMQEMENYDSLAQSAVFLFDLSTGRLLQKFVDQKKGSIFGDLILNSKGEAYVSDSQLNRLLKVNEKNQVLDEFFTSKDFINIQGLAFSENESVLFIADYVKGPLRLEMKSKTIQPLQLPPDVSLKGIDGLYFYKNSLIAIQNGVNPLRSTRYFLNAAQTVVTKHEIIDRAHPAFNEPTLGVLDGNNFYYIANSQWGGYDDNHQLKPDDQLADVVILKAILK